MADVMMEALSEWGVKWLYQSTQLWYRIKQQRKKETALAYWSKCSSRKVLYLASWHHTHEILLEQASNVTMKSCTTPEILLFKWFKTFLPKCSSRKVL